MFSSSSMRIFGCVLFISFISYLSSFGQKWEIGASTGFCQYKGDVMPKYKMFVGRPGVSAFGRMNLSPSISFKVQAIVGKIVGKDVIMKNDPYRQARAYSFKTDFLDWSGQVEYNFQNFRTTSSRIVSNWTPYVLVGGGGGIFKTVSIRKNPGSTNPFTTFSPNPSTNNFISLGFGFKKEWRQNWNWGFEFGTRFTNSDFIDNLGYYPDGSYENTTSTTSSALSPPPYLIEKFLVPGTKAKDIYYYSNIYISYLFYKIHCPTKK